MENLFPHHIHLHFSFRDCSHRGMATLEWRFRTEHTSRCRVWKLRPGGNWLDATSLVVYSAIPPASSNFLASEISASWHMAPCNPGSILSRCVMAEMLGWNLINSAVFSNELHGCVRYLFLSGHTHTTLWRSRPLGHHNWRGVHMRCWELMTLAPSWRLMSSVVV